MPSRIKGATLINSVAIVRELVGPNGYAQLVAGCPTPTRELLGRTMMAVEWVSADVWGPFLEIVLDKLARGDELKFRRLMRAVCKRDFAAQYRIYVQNITPLELIRKAPTIWSVYFDSGTFTPTIQEAPGEPLQATLQLADFQASGGIHLISVQAYLEQLLAIAGAKDPLVVRRREQNSGGRWSCEYQVTLR